MNLFFGGSSDKGRRAENEDCIAADEALGLYLVADGTGGEAGGSTASRIACEAVFEIISARGGELEALTDEAVQALIQQSLTVANERVVAGQADPALHRMATTITLTLHRRGRAHVAHVGDSRAYLLHNGDLCQLTRDHSLANYLADNPKVRPKVKRPGQTIVRALGLRSTPPNADQQIVNLYTKDVLMMCSDGVSNALSPLVLSEILSSCQASSAAAVARCLVRASLSHGSMDNTSAVVLQVGSDASEATTLSTSKAHVLGWLTFLEGPQQGTVVPLGGTTVIGTDQSCTLRLDDDYTSSIHTEVFSTPNGFAVRDLESTNGTYVNEVRIAHQPLFDADILRVGRTPMVFKDYHYNPQS